MTHNAPPPTTTPEVLLVEDSLPQAALYQQYLRRDMLTLTHVTTGAEAMAKLKQRPPQLLLLDLRLPDLSGQQLLAWVREQQLPTTVIVITGHSSVDVAVEVMRQGADDFLEKPVTAERLRTTVGNHLEKRRLRHLVDDLQQTFERRGYHGFVGASLPMQGVYRIIDAAAPSKATVFITGESGTGKEVCAAAIHQQGNRANQPFIALNCGAIPKDLMESEIFGHVRGAFTGANSERKGAATLADGGTLFLDEIGEMDLDLQTKLLRFVQTGSFQKVGDSKQQQVDVRFICATNRDPLEAVAAGRLREDLYYRLHVVPLNLPPLRERDSDIMAIAEHFLALYAKEENKTFQGFTPAVARIFRRYPWPGNVRQLQNVIRNILVLHDGEQIDTEHLPPPLDSDIAPAVSPPSIATAPTTPTPANLSPEVTPTGVRPLAQVEREAIEQAIALCDGNIPKAAALLDVSPSTIYRKKQQWETAQPTATV